MSHEAKDKENTDIAAEDEERKFRDLKSLILPENWKEPKWQREKSELVHDTNYKEYLATQLRARYIEIETDFKNILPCYLTFDQNKIEREIIISNHIYYLLQSAKVALEKDLDRKQTNRHDLFLATNLLDSAEESIIQIYYDKIARAKISNSIIQIEDLTNLDDKHKSNYKGQLNEVKEKKAEDIKPILCEIAKICNKINWEETINIGLQIERLRHYREWGEYLIILLFIFFPAIINLNIFNEWSIEGNSTTFYNMIIDVTPEYIRDNSTSAVFSLFELPDHILNFIILYMEKLLTGFWRLPIVAWISAMAIAIIGATGGYLSGLFQTRSSRIDLAFYEESVILSQLRLIFGGFAALASFAFLSWGLLPGITITSFGSFALVAFLSGFSERHFLRLLKIEQEDNQGRVKETSEAHPTESSKTSNNS